jgi:hypothetical protein
VINYKKLNETTHSILQQVFLLICLKEVEEKQIEEKQIEEKQIEENQIKENQLEENQLENQEDIENKIDYDLNIIDSIIFR